MAWRVLWNLSCDHCKKKASFAGQPSSAIERKARRYGWRFLVDPWGLIRHLCPTCAKKPETVALYSKEEKVKHAKT